MIDPLKHNSHIMINLLLHLKQPCFCLPILACWVNVNALMAIVNANANRNGGDYKWELVKQKMAL